ncbi:methylamine utilization protein [Thalassolituus sp.]|uniref:methylamine utilization protein n=1 Tax=Thalassolituus sp. TaxID=2030822 RepID=UPI001B3CD96B|nr:methylamine utilization protein [Thalassolituus sp.]MBQ0780196.1 methylamine utilization protein [Thalassolituus oleivorans]
MTLLKSAQYLVRFLVSLVCATATCLVLAQPITFTIVDESGKAVEGAVVSILGLSDSSPQPNAENAIMDQVERQFKPHVLLVQQGQNVSFPNSDNIRHHVYSFSKPKPFEIKLYANKPDEPVLFDNAGVVVLGCNIHDDMLGYIYVADSAYARMTDNQGTVSFNLSAKFKQISLWHQRYSFDESARMVLGSDEFQTTKSDDSHYTIVLPLAVSAPEPVAPAAKGFGNSLRR